MSYFLDNADRLELKVKSKEQDIGIRVCQIGAYWATKAHFTAYDSPSLVSLPTGAGKTALMMLLAFGLEARRVLIVTPTKVLREQTARKFKELDGLRISETVPNDMVGPQVHIQNSRVTEKSQWDALSKYDIVVALPHVVSAGYHQDIVEPPDDLFDLVFYDEAHHMRAPSWEKLLQDYNCARQVLLTATPFRRDKRRLPGHMVYYYPLEKAMKTGIYNPVIYDPVTVTSPDNRDMALIDKALRVLDAEREKYAEIKLLIRTDSIEDALNLEGLYSSAGLNVEAVHSKRTTKQNEDTLQRLRDGNIEGVIGVGMLGEGFDVPSLKVAVFHSPPLSFPFTVQLIGRVARPIDDGSATAHVIADPDQLRQKGVEAEVRRLYRDDRGWKELIPDLVERVAGSVLREMKHGSTELLLGVQIDDLRPFFSTRLYRTENYNLDFDADIDLGDDVAVYLLPQLDDYPFVGLITETVRAPSWATRTAIEAKYFDLHLYYYHSASKTLFESTTSDLLASNIRSCLMKTLPELVGGDELVRVMQNANGLDYIVVGLANAVGPTSAIPSYKMFLGQSVQGAINPSDARVFVRGHLFAKMDNQETRGISDGQGRVWSSKRSSIVDFITWCSSLGDELILNKEATAPTDFGFFSLPERIRSFPRKPIIVFPNPRLEVVNMSLFDDGTAEGGIEINKIQLTVGNFFSGQRRKLRVIFSAAENLNPVELHYEITNNRWSLPETAQIKIRVDYGFEHEDLTLQDLLNKFPPWFYLPDGGVVKGGFLYKANLTYEILPANCLVSDLDWRTCDVVVEYDTDERRAETGKVSVHDWLESSILASATDETIIFKDHGRGEAADFVVFDLGDKTVKLYHCKGCPKYTTGPRRGEANIGATIEHVKDVIDQVVRSNVWSKTRKLLSHIRGRNERDIQPQFVKGSQLFDDLFITFVPALWKYQVYIVNPGFNVQQVQTTDNTNVLLLTCYEWLMGTDTDLRIMGYTSPEESV